MFPGRNADQGVEVGRVFGDVADQHAFAAGAAVPTVIQRVGDQPGRREALGHVVVASGVLPETMRKHHDGARGGVVVHSHDLVRGPDVVHDAHAAQAIEVPFSAGHGTSSSLGAA